VICEFSRISVRPLRLVYERYLARALPAVARRAARNPAAYEYLAESIVDWPGQAELARILHAAGWSAVEWRNLTLGIVAVHVARRPGAVSAETPAA
jgi:demethylmenaquinone methyltransferase / 2-methoxy-6-polyprenyl-1,4-benzoquinol methylase